MMKMTWKLAESLMDNFACLAICANGGVPAEGFTDQQLAAINDYACNTFMAICGDWETLTGKTWDIEEPKEE